MNADDRQSIDATLAGDAAAFAPLVRRYQDRLYNAVLRVTGHPDDALDVTQDAFIQAYQALKSFKGDSEFFTWLYRIAFNAAVNQRRRRRATVSLEALAAGREGEGADPEDRSADVAPGAALERREEERLLQRSLLKLSAEHRTILVLKDIDGLKYEEIADVLGVPVGTVRSRIHRARLELRGVLEKALGEPPAPQRGE